MSNGKWLHKNTTVTYSEMQGLFSFLVISFFHGIEIRLQTTKNSTIGRELVSIIYENVWFFISVIILNLSIVTSHTPDRLVAAENFTLYLKECFYCVFFSFIHSVWHSLTRLLDLVAYRYFYEKSLQQSRFISLCNYSLIRLVI